MYYLLNVYRNHMQLFARYVYYHKESNTLIVVESDLKDKEIEKITFNNVDTVSEYSIIQSDKINLMVRNAESAEPKPVITIICEMKNARGFTIGYLAINEVGIVNICSSEDLVSRLDKGSIILTNGIKDITAMTGILGIKLTNKQNLELSREIISEFYNKYGGKGFW